MGKAHGNTAAEGTLGDMDEMLASIIGQFGKAIPLTPLPADAYAQMHYPRLVPFIKLGFRQYDATGFGHVATLATTGAFGNMRLATAVFTPSHGTSVPLLLIDAMDMRGKLAVFVEYYDCTKDGAKGTELEAVHERYSSLPDYPEKPAWYLAERAPWSLIKGGTDGARLRAMVDDTIGAYAALCASRTEASPENIKGLAAFANRMVVEGNPSSGILTKILGAEGAATFFRTDVMPVEG